MAYEPLLIALLACVLAWLGWGGVQGMRERRHFRRSLPMDVSHLSLPPPPEVRRVIDRLQAAGFVRLGEDRSTRPDFRQQLTTWILVDRAGTTAAEVATMPGAREPICGFVTLFRDSALLMTGHAFGEGQRAEGLVVQAAPASPEDAWRRHQEAQQSMASRHGEPLLLRSLDDLLAHSAAIRAKLMDHRPRCDGWPMGGWIAGAVIVWSAIAITGVAHLGSGMSAAVAADWLAGLRVPLIIGLLAAGLPTTLCMLFRFIRRLAPARET